MELESSKRPVKTIHSKSFSIFSNRRQFLIAICLFLFVGLLLCWKPLMNYLDYRSFSKMAQSQGLTITFVDMRAIQGAVDIRERDENDKYFAQAGGLEAMAQVVWNALFSGIRGIKEFKMKDSASCYVSYHNFNNAHLTKVGEKWEITSFVFGD